MERSARRKGKVEGFEEGMEKKAKEDAKKMIDRGFELEVVMDISGLSKEENRSYNFFVWGKFTRQGKTPFPVFS